MKRLMISGFAAIALLAAATTILWSHSLRADRAAGTGTMSLLEHRTSADVNKLPTEHFEDMSLVYSNGTPR